jgi:hypothetical protein
MPTTPKTRSSLVLLAVAALLAACANNAPPPLNTAGGRAIILGPEPGFDPASLADPWWRTADRGSTERFATVDLAGRPVLRIDAPADGQPTTSALGRRLAVPLLSMPYLHWAWYLEPAIFVGGPGDGLDRGLRLTIGFYGGHPRSPQITDRWFGGPNGMPASDRQIDLVFGGIAQPRGENAIQHMSAISDAGLKRELRPPAFNQDGEWKLEALDIANLYGQFWPRDRLDRVQIAFIGVSGLPGRPPVANPRLPLGYVAEVSLTR